jgi:hypothetical protein
MDHVINLAHLTRNPLGDWQGQVTSKHANAFVVKRLDVTQPVKARRGVGHLVEHDDLSVGRLEEMLNDVMAKEAKSPSDE